MWEAIALAVVTTIGTLVTIYFKHKLNRSELEQQRLISEMRFQEAGLSFEDYLYSFQSIDADIRTLFNETCFDRFLLLRAWNGFDNPKFTTAFFQIREDGQHPVSYVHFELDEDYIERLHYIKRHGFMLLKTENLPDSSIKRIYEMEGVKYSVWFYVSRKALLKPDGRETGSASVTYCSCATHLDQEPSEADIMKIRLIVDRIKVLANEKDS